METKDLPEEAPFVNEECGDTMWNEENLNPPRSYGKKSSPVESSTEEPDSNSSAETSK